MAEEELPPDPCDDAGDDDLEPIDLTNIWLRKFAWDVIACQDAQELQAKIGLVPTDQESAELEHVESHKRMRMVSPLEPAVNDFSDMISKILSTYLIDMASEAVKSQLTDVLTEKLETQNSEMVRIGALAIIATLIDTGVLTYTEQVFAKAEERRAAEKEQDNDE